jgi:hypothetical protein
VATFFLQPHLAMHNFSLQNPPLSLIYLTM